MLENTYSENEESAEAGAGAEIIIKKGSQFFSLSSGKCLCRIKSRNFLSAANVILDEQGKEKYHTTIVSYKNVLGAETAGIRERYAIFDNKSKIAAAYTVKADIKKKRSPLIIPRISELFVAFPGETFLISRLEDNSFILKSGENTISTLSPFALIKPQVMKIFGGQEVCLLAALFCLIRYIVHEEDLAVV